MSKSLSRLALALILLAIPSLVLAEGHDSGIGALAPGIAFGLAAIGGALGQSKAISAFMEAVGRNPGASGSMFTPLLIGLVFIETLVIFGFVVVILIK